MPSIINALTAAGGGVAISGDATGNLTIQSAGTNVATFTTGSNLQLNQSGGKILNSSGNPIVQSTGSVLQVVQGTYATQVSTTSTSYVDSGLTATITPTSASSKILVLTTNYWQCFVTSGTKRDSGGAFKLVRNSSGIWDSGGTVNSYIDGGTGATFAFNWVNLWNLSYLDSPATTSATTYKIQYTAVSGNTMQLNIGGSSAPSTITLMEIAA